MKRKGFISHNDFMALVGLGILTIFVIMLMILRINEIIVIIGAISVVYNLTLEVVQVTDKLV